MVKYIHRRRKMTLKKLQIDDYKLAVKAITNFLLLFQIFI